MFPEYQEKYLADPKSGPCPCFQKGDTFLLKRTAEQDDFYHLMNGKFCGEAWDAISRYVYTALQGGSIMHKWTNDERMMIACCNDGTRPVIFKIERIDIPETEEEKQWLEKQNFKNTADAPTPAEQRLFSLGKDWLKPPLPQKLARSLGCVNLRCLRQRATLPTLRSKGVSSYAQ